ncbi:glycosyltransferase family 4 protein, partial [Patescibacteria group bacterium]|nr:glycosyltransferase family 4 protein [Patescibacteria group bacterium]
MAKRLAVDGHEVLFLVAGFPDGASEEIVDGYRVIRLGGRWSVYWRAYRYYRRHLRGWADLVIDEVNTIPFFAKFYVKERNIILCYQLCRQIWFYQMFFPLNLIGYLIEPLYLYLLRDRFVLTESESAKTDLQKYGFKKEKIFVFNIGLEIEPIQNLSEVKKFDLPTILILGSLRSMKRPLHTIKAFNLAKKALPDLNLKIAGDASSHYGKKILRLIRQNPYKNSIVYEGRVSRDKKIELMKKSHLICVTSVKEGWGLIVTEANSQGTPAVVYQVDGLKDAVKNNITGIVCNKNTPNNLAINIIKIFTD